VYAVAMIVLLAIVALAGRPMLGLSPEAYLWMLVLGLVPQLVGHSTLNWALRHLTATYVAIVTLAEPLGSGVLAYLLLIPVVTFYLLRDWDELITRVHALVPRRVEPRVAQMARECDAVLAQFIRGQLLVMLGLAVVYTVGLWIVGLDSAFLIGMVAGLVSFVPYLGFIVGIALAGFAVLIQYGDLIHLVYIVAVFGVGQLIEGFVLSPWLVGDRIGLHPVAVIFAVMAVWESLSPRRRLEVRRTLRWPSRPCGRTSSIAIMTMNTAVSCQIASKNPPIQLSSTPRPRAARIAPGMLPSPPMITSANALKIRNCPMIGCTTCTGASAAPPMPHRIVATITSPI
jgi:hypothetical protein